MEYLKKIKNMSTPAKAALVFMMVNFFQQGLNIITGPIFTRILSATDYGIMSVYNSWLSLIGVVAMLSLTGGIFNNGMIDYEKKRNEFISSMLILSNLATVVVFFIYLILKKTFDNIIQLPNSLMILMFCNFIFTPAYSFWTIKERFEYRYKLTGLISIISSILSSLISIIGVLNVNTNKVETKLWSGALVIFPISIFFYISIIIKSKKLIDLKQWKYALKFNLPLIPHYFANYALSSSDRIMISNMINANSAGIYSIAYTAASMVSIVWHSINASFLPWTYKNLKEKNFQKIQERSKSILIIYAALCIGIVFFAPEVMNILAPKEYYEGIYVIPPVIAGTFFTAVYGLFGTIEFYYKSTVFTMVASFISAIVNIGLNFIFIPKFGYVAAAYTTLFCYIIHSVLHFINMRKVQEEETYDLKFILIISVIVVMICLLSTLLYSKVLIRYGIIIIFLFISFILRKHLCSYIKVCFMQKVG